MRKSTPFIVAVSFVVVACGGGSSSPPPKSSAPPAEEPWVCAADAKPTKTTYGHCEFAFGTLGNVCTQATGSGGEDEAQARKVCDNVKGTFSAGPCKPSPQGSCLARCGTSRESVDTIYFSTAADHQKACEGRKGVFIPPAPAP